MKYTVVAIQPQKNKQTGVQYQDAHGNLGYYITLTDPEGAPWSASMLAKNPPSQGSEVEGELIPREHNGTTYYSFKRAAPQQGGFGGKLHGKSPEEMLSIARQSSLKASIDFFNGSQPTAPSTDEVIRVAEKFAQYVTGNYMPKPAHTSAEDISMDEIEIEEVA